jgi:hypothetical protein
LKESGLKSSKNFWIVFARARESGNASFDIPFNREELAEFLSVDRSAMSSEPGRVKTGGLLTFRKNLFTLL